MCHFIQNAWVVTSQHFFSTTEYSGKLVTVLQASDHFNFHCVIVFSQPLLFNVLAESYACTATVLFESDMLAMLSCTRISVTSPQGVLVLFTLIYNIYVVTFFFYIPNVNIREGDKITCNYTITNHGIRLGWRALWAAMSNGTGTRMFGEVLVDLLVVSRASTLSSSATHRPRHPPSPIISLTFALPFRGRAGDLLRSVLVHLFITMRRTCQQNTASIIIIHTNNSLQNEPTVHTVLLTLEIILLLFPV